MNRIQSLITNLVQSAFIVNRVRVKSLIDFVLHLVEIEKKLLKESYVKNDIFPVKIFILYLYALCRMTLRFERRIRINHISFVVVKIRNKHFSIYFLYVYRFFPVSSRGSLWKYSRWRSREALFLSRFQSLSPFSIAGKAWMGTRNSLPKSHMTRMSGTNSLAVF